VRGGLTLGFQIGGKAELIAPSPLFRERVTAINQETDRKKKQGALERDEKEIPKKKKQSKCDLYRNLTLKK